MSSSPCHAADGYARATGRTGVVLATSGRARQSRYRHRQRLYGLDAVDCHYRQRRARAAWARFVSEIDIAGVTMPITKHNYIVKSVGELAAVVREAFYYAATAGAARF